MTARLVLISSPLEVFTTKKVTRPLGFAFYGLGQRRLRFVFA